MNIKKILQKSLAVHLIILFCTCTVLETANAASLTSYIRKYKNISVTPQQMKKVSKYKYLIDYFSSFAYIRPKRKVNTNFIKALMLAESNADPRALSKMGAKGLCQITYPTGKQAAKELAHIQINFRYVSKQRLLNLRPKDLYNPAINILITCYLIAKYNFNFKGKLDLVVAAWNAGENSIKNNRPPQYKETLNLIGKVNGYFIYFLKH